MQSAPQSIFLTVDERTIAVKLKYHGGSIEAARTFCRKASEAGPPMSASDT